MDAIKKLALCNYHVKDIKEYAATNNLFISPLETQQAIKILKDIIRK